MNRNSHNSAVLITGGAGYIGSQLVRDLATDPRLIGTTIRILDNMQRENYRALMDLPDEGQYQVIEGDILDPAVMKRALEGVDAILHLAAVAKTPLSFDHPTWTEQVNHWGTARLIESCLKMNVNRLVFVSSASVYGPNGTFDEESPLRPVGPYAQSKARAEQAVLTAMDRGLSPTILRLGTVFGDAPAARFDAVPNRLAYLAGINRPLTVYGTGEQVRPVLHVRDASSAIQFSLAQPEDTTGQVFNAVGENVSVLEIVDAIHTTKPDARVHYTEQDVLTHFSFSVDSSRLQRLGWEPYYSIETGMRELIGRFKNIEYMQLPPSNIDDDV